MGNGRAHKEVTIEQLIKFRKEIKKLLGKLDDLILMLKKDQ